MEPNTNIPNLQKQPQAQTQPSSGGGIGPLIAIIVILLIIVAGGIYFWLSRDNSPTPEEVAQEEQAKSDLADVEADLNTAELDQIENDLEEIDQEF